MKFEETLKCFCIALAVVVAMSTYMQFAFAYDWEQETLDGLSWTLSARVEGYSSPNPLCYSYAKHRGWRTCWGEPYTWPISYLYVWGIGHKGTIAGSEDYEVDYTTAGDDTGLQIGPGGAYASCDTEAWAKWKNGIGQTWWSYVLVSVLAGPV